MILIIRVFVKEIIVFIKINIKGFSWVDWIGLGDKFICIVEWYFIEGMGIGFEKFWESLFEFIILI